MMINQIFYARSNFSTFAIVFCFLILLNSSTLKSQESSDGTGYISVGTAFLFNDKGDMFTNRHVVEKCKNSTIRVVMKDGQRSNARVIAKSNSTDLAAISTDIHRSTFASLHTNSSGQVRMPQVPEDIFTAGFSSEGNWVRLIQGTWGQIIGFIGPNSEIIGENTVSIENIARMNVGRGASGSPVLDYNGLLLGIVYGGHEEVFSEKDRMAKFGYGKNLVRIFNLKAIAEFSNDYNLQIRQWSEPVQQSPTFIARHMFNITGLVICEVG